MPLAREWRSRRCQLYHDKAKVGPAAAAGRGRGRPEQQHSGAAHVRSAPPCARQRGAANVIGGVGLSRLAALARWNGLGPHSRNVLPRQRRWHQGVAPAGRYRSRQGCLDVVILGHGAAQGKDSGRDSSAFNSMAAWDALYGTKQGAGELRWASEDGDLAHYAADAVTAARASEDGSLVAIALQKCVVVCSVQSSAMSLQMVVAAAASTREKSLAQPSAAMRPVDVLACIAMADDGREQDKEGATGEAVVAEGPRTRLAQAVQEGNRRESAILQQICAETKGNNWVEAVKLYLEDLQAESANTEAARRTSKAQPAARARRGGGTAREGGGSGRAPMRVAVSEEVLDAVMRRCSEKGADGKFDEALLALVQAGAVTMRAHPSLLPYAIESGNLVLLESIFKFVPDLLEEHLVAGLKLILLSIRKHSMDTFITTWAAASPETPVLDHDAVRRHLLGARVCACCCVLAASWRAPARARAA